MDSPEERNKKIKALEWEMSQVDFWSDKNRAQAVIKEIADLKTEIAGEGKYDKGEAIMTILAGAGGVDAEDFARMLLQMYLLQEE